MSEYTIADIAKELGVSKSTVSRVINGTGRIGEETRLKVQNWIKEHDYAPNPTARALATNKTFNIAVVIPKDADKGDIPFFQKCLIVITETVECFGYDTLVSFENSSDISTLKRLVNNHKVDGVVLTRLDEEDPAVSFLKQENIPFVGIGTVKDKSIYQVDSDPVAGCFDLTQMILNKGYSNLVLLAGNENHLVNKERFEGYEKAFESNGLALDKGKVYWNMEKSDNVFLHLPEIMKTKPQCLVCMDDVICSTVLLWLRVNEYKVPQDIQVISMYDSFTLENNIPSITALNVNVDEMSRLAGNVIVNLLEEKPVENINQVDYQVKIRNSIL